MTPCVVRRGATGSYWGPRELTALASEFVGQLGGFGLGQDLLAGDALHVVNLAGVLLHALHELLLIVGLEHPTTFTLDSFLHVSPQLSGLTIAILALWVWGILGDYEPLSRSTLTTSRHALRSATAKRLSIAPPTSKTAVVSPRRKPTAPKSRYA